MVSTHDIATMTGLGAEEVSRTLDRLAELGAVTWDGMEERAPISQASEHQARLVAEAVKGMQRPVVETYSQPPPPETDRALALYDPSELDEECDLPPDKRRRILDTFYRLEELTYYELLAVEPTATKKEIKTAYYEIAAQYHPDRYFRKNLGSFKQKMELVFARVTLANDTLTRAQTRLEYDAYLEMQESTRKIERTLRDSQVVSLRAKPMPAPGSRSDAPPSVAVVEARVEPDALDSKEVETNPPSDGAQSVPVASVAPTERKSSPLTKESVKARREAFAARLSGGRISKEPPPPKTPAPEPRRSDPKAAAESLRRHVSERKEAVRNVQIKRYTDAAQEALSRNDPAAAANSYQLALQLDPDNQVLTQAHADAQLAATSMLAGGYLQQAQYEERAERWREAARSYTRAADGMLEDAWVQSKAAEMMLRADLDLRKAAEYAKRATGLAPKNAAHHVILGKIYLAAGLALNARREIELAAELSPSDASIARLLETIRKGARS